MRLSKLNNCEDKEFKSLWFNGGIEAEKETVNLKVLINVEELDEATEPQRNRSRVRDASPTEAGQARSMSERGQMEESVSHLQEAAPTQLQLQLPFGKIGLKLLEISILQRNFKSFLTNVKSLVFQYWQ